MLLEISIKDFAIIDNLNVSFNKGLNILTGETGAGKSIIIDAVKLILGDRVTGEVIRSSCDEAAVEAVFDISGEQGIEEFLDASGVAAPEGGSLIVKRVFSRTGRNRVFINGSNSTVSILAELGRNLVDIYGQHDHQSLINPATHIDILDSFAGLIPLRSRVNELFSRFSAARSELEKIKENLRVNKEKQDFLVFQSHEIGSAALKQGEDEELKKEREKLVNAERLLEAANSGHEILYSSSGSVVEKIGQALNRLKDALKYDEDLAKTAEILESCLYQVEDISALLRDYSQDITFDPKYLEDVDNRLDLINKLKKKYGQTIQEIIDRKAEIDMELELAASCGEKISELEQEVEIIKKEALEIAAELSKKRKTTVKNLKNTVEAELELLNMKKTVFEPRMEELKGEDGSIRLTASGIDRIEFFISPNVGEEPKPLAKIASGGELSRIMLALKRAAARAASVPVLIFDEIDAGIGGGTAEAVGRKLKEVSQEHQVICITHLPQIAAYADRHYFVSKVVKGSRTVAEIKELSGNERTGEISRMLGGMKITDKTREHAREMLENARK